MYTYTCVCVCVYVRSWGRKEGRKEGILRLGDIGTTMNRGIVFRIDKVINIHIISQATNLSFTSQHRE